LAVGDKAWAVEFVLDVEQFGDGGGVVLVVLIAVAYNAFVGSYALCAVDVDFVGSLGSCTEPFSG